MSNKDKLLCDWQGHSKEWIYPHLNAFFFVSCFFSLKLKSDHQAISPCPPTQEERPWITSPSPCTRVEWRDWWFNFTDCAAGTPTPSRRSLYPHAQRVDNIFLVPFLGLSEFSQGNMKVKRSTLTRVIPIHLPLLADLKQTIKLNTIVCETCETTSHGGLDDFSQTELNKSDVSPWLGFKYSYTPVWAASWIPPPLVLLVF